MRGSEISIGVYRGRACGMAPIEAYEKFLGRQVRYILDFMIESPTWQQFEAGALTTNADVSAWQHVLGPRGLALGVPACCCGSSWRDEASGSNDPHWRAFGSRLISLGLGGSLLRIGREFNGSWYQWKATEAAQQEYIAGYRHVVTLLRGLPGAAFRFCWNPILGTGNLSRRGVESCYPGDDIVDEIGIDLYDGSWSGIYPPNPDAITTAEQQKVFDGMLTERDGLRSWHNLALSHGKPLSFPEWGLRLWKDGGVYHGGGDNAVLINGMAQFIIGSPASWHALWEDPWGAGVSDPDNHPGRTIPAPMARAAFLQAFGS